MNKKMKFALLGVVQASEKMPLYMRSPFIELEGLLGSGDIENFKSIEGFESMFKTVEHAESLKSPRVIKTHLPLELLPPNLLETCKVIFVGRNAKDCCVSYYHHYMNFPGYQFTGDFEAFAKMFRQGTVEYGSYWSMLKVSYFASSSE